MSECKLQGILEIDHIIPSSYFNFSKNTDRDFKMCRQLKNLQPLWAKDNIRKGGIKKWAATSFVA